MIRKSLFLAAAAMILAGSPPSPSTPRSTEAKLREHIRTLSDDSFEGRGPATAGETKTVQYLTQQFQAAGLQPGGELVNGQRQWTQRVPLLKSGSCLGAAGHPCRPLPAPMAFAQGEQICRPLADERHNAIRAQRTSPSSSPDTA